MGGHGDGVESDGDDQLQQFEGGPQGVLNHEGQEHLAQGEDEKTGLLVPFAGDVESVVGQDHGLAAVELQHHAVLQLGDQFLGQVCVADGDDEGAADVASERLHRDVLDALDLAGHVHRQEQGRRLASFLHQDLVRKAQVLLLQGEVLDVLLKPAFVKLEGGLPGLPGA